MTHDGVNKILRNTLALYIRMIFLTLISLFTYRVIFQALGASDYGTYNVVGGFVTMFGFVSGTMIISSQRYFAIGLANNDWATVNKSFSVNLAIYAVLSLMILVIAETAGLWFVMNKLNLVYDNMLAIIMVYETSIAVFIIGMLVSPFLALLIADENLTVYSWVSIIEGILKIAVAYILYVFSGDKLVTYSFLLLFVAIIINLFYVVYCLKKYKKLRFKFCRDKEQYKSVFSFINWSLIGAVASIGKNQGINIIINIFFGTVVNAARAIAYQLNTVISSFAQNFMKAIDPRITKSYANGDEDAFISVIYISSKISFYLLLIVAIPFMANIEYVLTLWLGEIPEYTTIFTILAFVDALILSMTNSIFTAVQAVGKIKIYQLTVGGLSLMNLPLAYILLKITDNPIAPFVVAIFLDCLITIGRLVNFKHVHEFLIGKFCFHIFLPAAMITAISVAFNVAILPSAMSFAHLILNVLICIAIMGVLILLIGLNKSERKMLKRMLPFWRK